MCWFGWTPFEKTLIAAEQLGNLPGADELRKDLARAKALGRLLCDDHGVRKGPYFLPLPTGDSYLLGWEIDGGAALIASHSHWLPHSDSDDKQGWIDDSEETTEKLEKAISLLREKYPKKPLKTINYWAERHGIHSYLLPCAARALGIPSDQCVGLGDEQ
jgi:hypothetical protein